MSSHYKIRTDRCPQCDGELAVQQETVTGRGLWLALCPACLSPRYYVGAGARPEEARFFAAYRQLSEAWYTCCECGDSIDVCSQAFAEIIHEITPQQMSRAIDQCYDNCIPERNSDSDE